MTYSLLKKCAASAAPILLAAASLLSTAPVAGALPTGTDGSTPGDVTPGASNPTTTTAPDWFRAVNTPCGEGAVLLHPTYALRNRAGQTGGLAEVYWKNNTGQDCLVVLATGSHYGATNQTITAAIKLSNGTQWVTDTGRYRYLAGPVYVSARHQCIDIYGELRVDGSSDPYVVHATHIDCL